MKLGADPNPRPHNCRMGTAWPTNPVPEPTPTQTPSSHSHARNFSPGNIKDWRWAPLLRLPLGHVGDHHCSLLGSATTRLPRGRAVQMEPKSPNTHAPESQTGCVLACSTDTPKGARAHRLSDLDGLFFLLFARHLRIGPRRLFGPQGHSCLSRRHRGVSPATSLTGSLTGSLTDVTDTSLSPLPQVQSSPD